MLKKLRDFSLKFFDQKLGFDKPFLRCRKGNRSSSPSLVASPAEIVNKLLKDILHDDNTGSATFWIAGGGHEWMGTGWFDQHDQPADTPAPFFCVQQTAKSPWTR